MLSTEQRGFDHPSDLLFYPNMALRGLRGLFGMAETACQMNEVMAEEFACLLDVLTDAFERQTEQANAAYRKLEKRLETRETPKPETFVLEPVGENRFRRTKIPVGQTLDDFMAERQRQAAE